MPGHINKKRLITAMVIQAAMTGLNLDSANAQTSQNRESEIPSIIYTKIDFDIPSLLLRDSLNEFSRQTGIAITILPGTPEDARSVAVHGRISPEMALARLLGPHQVPYRFSGGALIIGQSGDTGTTQVLPAITVNAPVPNVSMPNDSGSSGLSVIDQDTIKVIGTGDKDPIRLLRVLPNVNFDNEQFKTSRYGEQDLTPEVVSISGGKYYENSIVLDGMRNTSLFDTTTNGNEADADQIGVSNPMALFSNSDLLREVAVYDSNIPAKYSGFTGGVLDMKTIDPAHEVKGWAGMTRQRDQWVHYRREDDQNATANAPAAFVKTGYDAAITGPVSDRIRVLAAASTLESELTRYNTSTWGGGERGTTVSRRQNFMASIQGDVTPNSVSTIKLTYAPYLSEYVHENMNNDKVTTESDAFNISNTFEHHGDVFDADVFFGFGQSGFSRDAPNEGYTWNSATPRGNFCDAASCPEGGYGPLNEKQKDFNIKGTIGKNIFGVKWSAGADAMHSIANRMRPEDISYYYTPKVDQTYGAGLSASSLAGGDVVCADPADPTCVSGEQALTSLQVYKAHEVDVSVTNLGTWLEANKNFPIDLSLIDSFDVRTGMRFDWSDYRNNVDMAPRLSGTVNFPQKISLTLAANRYYANDNLVYAIYENSLGFLRYTRSPTVSGTDRIYSDNWTLASDSTIRHSSRDLNTPYSDERSAALTMPLLWGDGRLKYIQRHNRDEISLATEIVDGKNVRVPTNNGWTNYQSVSMEWMKSLQNHAFLLNATWSDTKRNNATYMEEAAEDDYANTRVYYNGNLVDRSDIAVEASNFAQPLVINAGWTSKWLEDALTINLTGKYRLARHDIIDSGRNITVSGTNYDIFEKVRRNPQVRFDATVSYQIETWGLQHIEVLGYVENIFNARDYTAESSSPYERGRAYWGGIKYKF